MSSKQWIIVKWLSFKKIFWHLLKNGLDCGMHEETELLVGYYSYLGKRRFGLPKQYGFRKGTVLKTTYESRNTIEWLTEHEGSKAVREV